MVLVILMFIMNRYGSHTPSFFNTAQYHLKESDRHVFPRGPPQLGGASGNFLFKFNRFFHELAIKIAKKFGKIDFFKIFDFSIFLANFFETLSQYKS